MASVTENVTIKIREDGSRVVSRNLRDMGNAADEAEGQISGLQSLLGGLVTAATVTSLIRMADQFTNLQNRLRLVTTDSANLARVTKELGAIANSTRSDFTATAELYARMAASAKDLGLSQKELLDFTKSLNQAVILSGASAEEAAGGLRQLAQGMASGALRGDELNSILENLPAVADVIAKGLGVTRGELRKMGEEGKITATQIIDAFKQAQGELEQGFGTTVPTVGQSLTVLKNNFLLFLGQLDATYGITQNLAGAIMTLANNLDTLVPLLAGVGAAMGVAFSAALIQKFIVQIRALWALMLANPFVAVAAAIAAVAVSLTLMRDQIQLGIDDTTTLGDLMRAAWESISPVIDSVRAVAGQFFDWLSRASGEASIRLIKNGDEVGKRNEATWLKLVRVVVQVFDMIGGTVRGVMHGVANVISGVIAGAINSFKQLGEAAGAALEGDWDGVKAAVASSKAGFEMGTDIAGNFKKGFDEEIKSQADSGLEATLDAWIKRAQEIGKERMANAAPEGGLAGGGGGTVKPPTVDPKAIAALKQLKSELESVMDAANPLDAAQRRLAESREILNKAVAAGLISSQKAAEVEADLTEQMRDQLDPLGAVNRMLDESIDLLRLSNDERSVEADMLQFTEQLRRSGLDLSREELDALRAKLVVEQELNRIAGIRDQLEQDSLSRRSRDLGEKIRTAGSMVAERKISGGDAVRSLAGDIPGLDQTADFFAAQQEQYAAYYEAIDLMRQQDLISETAAQQAKTALFREQYATQFAAAEDALTNLASLQRSENKKMAAVGKAAAIAQTTIDTYKAATGAYAAMAGIPYVGPFLGIAAAGAAIAAGMANVQAIKSQNVAGFRTGGSMIVGGNGGEDSQTVAFRATPGERININTPAQARALEKLAAQSEQRAPTSVTQNVTIVQQGKPDRRTSSQQARDLRRETQAQFERTH